MKMYLLYFNLFLLSLITFPNQSFSFNPYIDYAFFQEDGEKIRVEIYYLISTNEITYKEKNNIYIGNVEYNLNIFSAGIEVYQKQWNIKTTKKYITDTNNILLFGIVKLELEPGQYNFKYVIYDENNSNNKKEIEHKILVPNLYQNKITIGGILLSSFTSTISENEKILDESFVRFDKYIIPNPSLEYYGSELNLKAYIEIYNAKKISKLPFKLNYQLFDITNRLVYNYEKTVLPEDNFLFDFADLKLDSIHTGIYYFVAKIIYSNDSTYIFKKIYYINPNLKPLVKQYFTENELFEKSYFSTLNEDETNLQLEMIKVIANPLEIEQIKLLTDILGKQRYLFRFWHFRDPDTNTVINEEYENFKNRVNYANTYFSIKSGKDGWKSERGNVILRYGIPTERKQYEAGFSNRAYEEWFYENVQGGVYFYFVDKSHVGNFILVHSTARQEVYNPNWYNDHVPQTTNEKDFQKDYDNYKDYKVR
jgi:GWxTD domain-containing protein